MNDKARAKFHGEKFLNVLVGLAGQPLFWNVLKLLVVAALWVARVILPKFVPDLEHAALISQVRVQERTAGKIVGRSVGTSSSPSKCCRVWAKIDRFRSEDP